MIYLSNNAKQQSYIQKKELSLQREELTQTREELKGQKEQLEEQNKTLKIQRFENTFFQMLTQFQEIVNNITYSYKDISGKVHTVKGRQAFYDSFEIAEHESKLPDWHPTKNLRTSIDDLSKYTHVEPETFDVDITTVTDVSYNIMEDTLSLPGDRSLTSNNKRLGEDWFFSGAFVIEHIKNPSSHFVRRAYF